MGLAEALGELLGGDWEVEGEEGVVVASLYAGSGRGAVVRARHDGDALATAVGIGPWPAFSREAARRLTRVLIEVARSVGAESTRLRTVDMVVRDEARRAGFEGGLREDLTFADASPRPDDDPERSITSTVGAAIEDLLPGSRVVASITASRVRRLLQHAVSGTGAQLRVDITVGDSLLRVALPQRADLMPEAVAMAAGTALAIKKRFDGCLRQVGSLSFDLSQYGMSQHKVTGAASRELPKIHLSAVLCCAELAATARSQTGRPRPKRPSAPTNAPFAIDKVTAHEFGHQLDFEFQSRRYQESIEFRRRLGLALGVATLEVALRGRERGAGPDALNAWQRVAEDVSLYATSNIAEAMAELFAQWWFSDDESPHIIRCFGQLIGEYFPVEEGSRP